MFDHFVATCRASSVVPLQIFKQVQAELKQFVFCWKICIIFAVAAGYRSNYDIAEVGDAVQPESADGAWLYEMKLVAAFEYIKVGLKLAEGSVELVHPELLKAFMEILLQGTDENASVLDIQEIEAAQTKRS